MISITIQIVLFMYLLHATITFVFRGFFRRSFTQSYILAQTIFTASQFMMIYYGYNVENHGNFELVDLAMGALMLAYLITSNTYRMSLGLPIIRKRFRIIIAFFVIQTLVSYVFPALNPYRYSISIFLFFVIGVVSVLDVRKIKRPDRQVIFLTLLYFFLLSSHLITLFAIEYMDSLQIFLSITVLRVFLWFAVWVNLLFRESQISFSRSITANLKVSEKEMIMNEIVEQSLSNIVVTDPQANIIYVNKHYLDFSGYEEWEIIGKNPRIFASGRTPRSVYEDMWATIRSGNTWSGEFQNKRRNGDLYLESAQIVPIFDINGEVQFYLATKQDITLERELRQQLEHLASYDDLTNVMKRNKFYDSINKERKSHDASVYHTFALLDVDNFKAINDENGHNAGDLALTVVANTAMVMFAEGSYVCRFGGDEFGLFISNTDQENANKRLALFMDTISAQSIRLRNGEMFNVSISMGATMIRGDEPFEDAFERADHALYRSKEDANKTVKWK